jgi:Bifunctional DNA primase/polymerase, N-terminal/Family of unknown function (DUF5906)
MQDHQDDNQIRHDISNTNGLGKQAESSAKEIWNQSDPFPIAADTRKPKTAVWTACKCETQLEAALVYASYGIPVIPCLHEPRTYKGKLWKAKGPLPEIGEGGLYLATIDPEQIKKWWTRWPKALIGVPGGRRTGMWYFDVDSKEGHGEDGLGAWERLQIQHGAVDTRAHKTGTNGLHFIFKWDNDRHVGCPTSSVPPGIEIKGEGGYVIFPPSPYELNGQTVRYDISADYYPAIAPVWLYDLIKIKSRRLNGSGNGTWAWSDGFGQKKLDEVCEQVREATEHHWDEACRKVYMLGRWAGGGALDIEKASCDLANVAKECPAPNDYVGNVERAFRNGVALPASPFIEEEVLLTDFVAYLPQHLYIYIPTRETWPAASVNGKIPSVDKSLKANVWLDQNRHVEQMTWAPGQEMLVHNRLMADGGWFEKQGVSCFNNYRPPTIKPGDIAKANPWVRHVHNVFGDDAEHIIKWCAQRVQHPEVKINHALVLGSDKQGTGKDTMLEPVKRAIGPWNFGEVSPQQIFGRFNGFLKKVILRVNEARDLGDVSRYQFYDHMKAFTASPPDVLRVDEKHLHEYSILNCVGVVITTNYKANGIYLPAEDRRHYVAWSDVSPEDFDKGYWDNLWRWYDEGGYGHVASYLAGYDLSAFDPKEPPPKTQAFWDIVDSNRPPEDSELADALDQLGNPKATTIRHVANRASFEFASWLRDKRNAKVVSNRFKDCGYVSVGKPDRKDGYWKVAGVRMVVYCLSELSRSDQLSAINDLIEREKVPVELAEAVERERALKAL